jgi:drug/metabolite transporter (DMT)-like permease
VVFEKRAHPNPLLSTERAANFDRVTDVNETVRLGPLAVDVDLAPFARRLRLRTRLEEARDVEPHVKANGFGWILLVVHSLDSIAYDFEADMPSTEQLRAGPLTAAMPSSTRRVPTYVGLTMGVTAVSFAAVLVREASAPALVVAAYRLGLATLVLVPVTLVVGRRQVASLRPRDIRLLLLAGCLLAVHFASWISSLGLTSVASSVVLVTASPLFVAVASHLLFGEPMSRRMLSGIALGVVGSAVIASGEIRGSGEKELLGDAMAIAGAAAMAGYLLVGRTLRSRVPVLPYVSVVYGTAAIVLLAAVWLTHESLSGYGGRTYVMLVLLALVPQLVGHSLLNWSLARVTATVVSISVMAEPIGSTALAYLVLHERPPAASLAGGVLVLLGVYRAVVARDASEQEGREKT